MRAPKRSVWVVDDSPLDGARTANSLHPSYDVSTFTDGSAVLEHLSAHTAPDVLVLDWVMPGISGVEVCRFIRNAASEHHRSLAILLLTGHQRTEQIVEGLSAGANDYLSKPYAIEELRARVAALVRSRELLERAETAERALRSVLDSGPDALFVLDENGRVSYANAEAERALRLRADVSGRTVTDLVPGLELGVAVEGDATRTLKDVNIGDEVYSPVVRSFGHERAAGNTTLSFRNVTEQRRREATRLDFYAIVAHDLRSPLNALLLRTELMLRGARGPLSELVENDLKNIRKNLHTQVELITDFLDLARLESPAGRIEMKAVDVTPLLTGLLEDLRPLVDAREHVLTVTLPDEPAVTLADPARLRQVLTNLVSNAVKFTPERGRIRIAVELDDGFVSVRVSDNGPGIDAELVPTLSQRYVRARGVEASGTGLGLMIVREILEAHRSTLHIESEPGRGSTFSFRLPRA